MAREIRPGYPELRGMTKAERHAYSTAVEKAAAAMAEKRARPVEPYAIPADLSIPAFLKRAA